MKTREDDYYMTFEEIGKVLGVSADTARLDYIRAMQKIRNQTERIESLELDLIESVLKQIDSSRLVG